MIAKGATHFNWGLAYACSGGHFNIVELMIAKGATDYNWGLANACYEGHIKIVKFIIISLL